MLPLSKISKLLCKSIFRLQHIKKNKTAHKYLLENIYNKNYVSR